MAAQKPDAKKENPTSAVEPLAPTCPFTRRYENLVKGFTCVKPGNTEQPWEEDVRLWITAPPGGGGAIDAVEVDGSDVWLYLSEKGELIGFVSLGLHLSAPDQPADGQVVLFLGVSGVFRGQGYGPRIFQWVIEEAARRHLRDGASSPPALC